MKKLASGIMAFAVTLTTLSALPQLEASAAPATPRMIVDMNNRQGEIMHGASGFLYGFSSDGVPTTDLTTPLKPIVLATKGALGTEHPYSDALDVAETFFKSGGQMIQMYCSNYYAIFGPRPVSYTHLKMGDPKMYEIIKSNVIKRLRIVTNSLQFRLISAFCLISILPLVFINLMSYYNTTGIVQENTDELAEVNLVQTDKSVRSTLAAYEDLLFQLYTGDDIVNDVDELNAGGNEALAVNQLRRTLRGIANIKDSIQCITIITESGDIIFYDKPTASSIKNSWLDTMNLTPEELYDKISNENSTQYLSLIHI